MNFIMKKTFKTIVYSFVAVALFGFSANSVLAATVFNNHTSDFATVRVSNYTDYPGSDSNWSSSVSADAGDIVSVIIYYHNNGSENAVSTKIKINNSQTLGSAWTHTFSGSVSAFNANQVSGSATVNISSSQSLTYIPGSVVWFPNQMTTGGQSLPNGQNGSEIFSSSGLNIGTIAPGWPSQGSVVLKYKVSGNVEQPQDQEPIVTTNSYSLNDNQATLHGHVDGQGENPYTYFVYGTNSNLNGGNSTAQDYQNQTTTNFSETVYVNDNTTYYYKACATTDGGSDCGVIKSFWTGDDNGGNDEDIEVTTLSATNVDGSTSNSNGHATLRGDIIETNGEDVVRFFEYGEDEDDLDETTYISGETDNEGVFSKTINGLGYGNYYFRACIESQDSDAEDCGSIKKFSIPVIDDFGSCGSPSSVTTYASGISGTSAVLNGVSTAGNNSASSYFQYGTTTNLGSSVGYQTVSFCGSLYNSYNLTGLQPNTTYYYRIVTGSTYGEIKSFTTPTKSIVVIPQPPKPKPTPTPKPTDDDGSLIYLALDITPDFENVYEGDTVNFDVDYRNLYNGTLEDVVINVRFPEEIEFRKSTEGVYSELDRSLAIELGDLKDDEEGTILIQADVLGRLNGQGVVVTTAEGTYVHPIIENAQGSSMAHALNTILEKQSVFDFDSLGIFGWLILILLILLIIWISRKIYHDHEDRKNQKPTFQIN